MAQQGSTKKKVLVFIPEFPVLTETFIERELAKLAERDNIKLTVFSLAKGSGEISPVLQPLVKYKRISSVDVFFSVLFSIFAKKRVNKAKEILKSTGLSAAKRRRLLMKGMGYARVFALHRPDFIIAHFMSEASTVAMVAATVLGVPYAISAHAKDVTVNPHCMKQKVENAAFVLICNKHAYDACVKSVDPEFAGKVLLKYHGLEIRDFERTDPQNEVPVILNIARLEEKKGHSYLFEAARMLYEEGFKFKLIVVGPGSLYPELSDYIVTHGLMDVVDILGGGEGLPFSETKRFYDRADIFAFPGINTEEGDADGIANVLLESAASRLPIVATDSGSTTEFLQDGASALIVPQRDSAALAVAMKKLITDKEMARRLSDAAYQKVSADFNIFNTAAIIEELILSEIR